MRKYTDEQLAVVDSTESKILCIAGAGTGKTHTLVGRLIRMADSGIDMKSVLVLTFTRNAASEMAMRFRSESASDMCPDFYTFHAFCYRLISSDPSIYKYLGYTDRPIVPDDEVVKDLTNQVISQLGLKMPKKYFQPDAVRSADQQFQYEIFTKLFKKRLRSENYISYDELLAKITALFVEDNPLIYQYKDRYKHILVDEFQDTDPKQWEFVKSFTNVNKFVCGDALQSIYSFRGADSSIIKQLSKDDTWATHKLTHNFRSTQEIVKYANKHADHAESEYRIDMVSNRCGVPVVELKNRKLHELISDISSDHSYALLARTNREVDKICDMLSRNDIPYVRSNKNSVEIKLIKSAQDDAYKLCYLSSLLTESEYQTYLVYSIRSNVDLSELFPENKSVHDANNKINKLADLIKDKPEGYIYEIFEVLNHPEVDVTEISDIDSVVEYFSTAHTSDEENIYVGTIHSSKGLEYDNVIVTGVNGNSFPLSGEENLNLFYVAVTRAKNTLTVLYEA